jgi:hypothetical protein
VFEVLLCVLRLFNSENVFGQWVMRNIAFDVVAYGEASDQDWVTQKIVKLELECVIEIAIT